MPFDVQGAIKSGYTEDEIMRELSKFNSFDYVGAMKSGYNKQEIISHLSSLEPPKQPDIPVIKSEPSTFDSMNMNLMRMGGGAELSQVPESVGAEGVRQAITDPRMVGAAGGAILGSMAGGPAGAIPGAMLGGVMGNTSQQVTQAITGDPNAPKSILESTGQTGVAGLRSGVEQAIGESAIRIAGKVLNPFAASITDAGMAAYKTLNKYMPENMFGNAMPGVTASEAAENHWLHILDNVTKKSWWGGSIMEKYQKMRGKAVDNMIDDVVSQIGPEMGASDLGDLIVATSNKNWKLYKNQVTNPIYNSVAKIADPQIEKIPIYSMVDGQNVVTGYSDKIINKGAVIDLTAIKESLKDKISRIKELKDIAGDEMGDNLVMAVSELPDNVSYSTAKELRTRLIASAENNSVVNPKAPAIGVAKNILSQVDEAMTNGLKEFDSINKTNSYDTWRTANNLYSEGKSQFNNKFLRKMTALADPKGNKEPAKVMGRIFQKGGIDNVEKVVDAVGPDIHQQMQRWYVEDTITKAFNDETKLLDPGIFYDRLFGKSAPSSDFADKFFSNETRAALKNASDILNVVNIKKSESGLSSLAIQFAQIGAFGALASTGLTGAGTAILVSPAVIAKIFTSPMASKWFMNTYRIPVNFGGQLTSNITRLAQVVERVEKEVDSDNNRADKARQ